MRATLLQTAIEEAKHRVLGSCLYLPDLCESTFDASQTELRGKLMLATCAE